MQMIGGQHDLGGKDAFESFKQRYGKQYGSEEGMFLLSACLDVSLNALHVLRQVKRQWFILCANLYKESKSAAYVI
jgi:hypothetical protein